MDEALRFSEETELLYKGDQVCISSLQPESLPLFLSTAFTFGDLDDVQKAYERKDYTYIRTRNPDRKSLADVISYLEKGKQTLIFSSGMGAITTTYFALLQPGDHFLANENLYGETYDAITVLLKNYGVEIEFVDFRDLDAVENAIQPNTKMLYTEVVSNPTDTLADLPSLAVLAHRVGALLMVDNTFTTPLAIKPLTFGADIVINSLTKFINGHSDALAGAITLNDPTLFEKIHTIRMLTGTSGSPFSAWLVYRGIHTIALRVNQQMQNAARLAVVLEHLPFIRKVNHPSLTSHPQFELGKRLFRNGESISGMFSFEMPDDRQKINAFMNRLHLAHYAPTLGGVRTTLSYPLYSSHFHLPQKEQEKMGITAGLMRVSTGIEAVQDLIDDFTQALQVFA